MSATGRLDKIVARVPGFLLPRLFVEILARCLAPLLAGRKSVSGTEARLRGMLSTRRFGAEGLRLGRGIVVDGVDNVILRDEACLYGDLYLGATGERGRIEIGRGTHVDRRCVLYGQGGIHIGQGCAIASGVIIYSQTNQYDVAPETPVVSQGTRYAPVRIGDDVWLGAGAIVLPGTVIGDHAVIAAGAVVNRNVDEWLVVGGVPAKPIRDRRSRE